MDQLAVEREDHSEGRLAQLPRIRRDRLEHRLHVALRLADHAQDLAGRRLLLQRFGQVAVARLQLVEQPRVLDRDHRLVGEGLEHGDLSFGEHRRFGASDGDRSNRAAVAEHRHGKDAAKPGRLSQALQAIFGILANIRNVDDGSGENGAGGRTAAARRHRVRLDGSPRAPRD